MAQPGVLSADELEAIAAGALPSAARRRLAELAGIDGLSTSFFSPTEDGLAPELGIVGLGQVIGASTAGLRAGVVRAVGPGSAGRHRPGEARWLERSGIVESWTRARRRAVWRIQEQAAMLGADAVVGVRVTRRQHEVVAEVVLTGTGVRLGTGLRSGTGVRLATGLGSAAPRTSARAPALAAGRATGARALVSGLSLAQLAKLGSAGAEPVGLVGGCASIAAVPSVATARAVRRRRRARTSREVEEFTFAFGETRRRAVERLRLEAAGLGASGVIGIELDDLRTFRGGGDFQVVLHLLGTAVRTGPAGAGGSIDGILRTGSEAR